MDKKLLEIVAKNTNLIIVENPKDFVGKEAIMEDAVVKIISARKSNFTGQFKDGTKQKFIWNKVKWLR